MKDMIEWEYEGEEEGGEILFRYELGEAEILKDWF